MKDIFIGSDLSVINRVKVKMAKRTHPKELFYCLKTLQKNRPYFRDILTKTNEANLDNNQVSPWGRIALGDNLDNITVTLGGICNCGKNNVVTTSITFKPRKNGELMKHLKQKFLENYVNNDLD